MRDALPSRPLIVHSRGQIVEALRARRHELGLTCEGLDAHAGFSDRYVSKLENPASPSGKLGFHFDPAGVEIGPSGNIRCTAMAEVWLDALGLCLVLVDRATADAIGAMPAPPPSPREHVARTGGDAAPGHALARAAKGAKAAQALTQYVAADRAVSAAEVVRTTLAANPFVAARPALLEKVEELARQAESLGASIGEAA